MELRIYSFYDKVSKQSICLNFYRDNEEARREASHIFKSIPEHRRSDVILVHIGFFNTETLIIDPCEPIDLELVVDD